MIVFKPAAPDRVGDETSDPLDDLSEHEWAEYNLPAVMLIGIAAEMNGDDDAFAFVGLGVESDVEIPDGSR